RLGKLALQSLRGVGLGEELGLEIEARRKTEKSMGRPREAVNAPMLAAPIGIDGTIEADVWGVVSGQDAPGRDLLNFGRERLELGERFPAVVLRLVSDRLVAAGAIGLG